MFYFLPAYKESCVAQKTAGSKRDTEAAERTTPGRNKRGEKYITSPTSQHNILPIEHSAPISVAVVVFVAIIAMVVIVAIRRKRRNVREVGIKLRKFEKQVSQQAAAGM